MNELGFVSINGRCWDISVSDYPMENNTLMFEYKGKIVEVFKSSLNCFVFKYETIIGKIEGSFKWVSDLIRSIIPFIK